MESPNSGESLRKTCLILPSVVCPQMGQHHWVLKHPLIMWLCASSVKNGTGTRRFKLKSKIRSHPSSHYNDSRNFQWYSTSILKLLIDFEAAWLDNETITSGFFITGSASILSNVGKGNPSFIIRVLFSWCIHTEEAQHTEAETNLRILLQTILVRYIGTFYFCSRQSVLTRSCIFHVNSYSCNLKAIYRNDDHVHRKHKFFTLVLIGRWK